jgi:hypothetical protein
MKRQLERSIVALGIALASTDAAYVEPSVQEQPLRGDFYTSTSQLAVSPIGTWGVGHALRDDAAA